MEKGDSPMKTCQVFFFLQLSGQQMRIVLCFIPPRPALWMLRHVACESHVTNKDILIRCRLYCVCVPFSTHDACITHIWLMLSILLRAATAWQNPWILLSSADLFKLCFAAMHSALLSINLLSMTENIIMSPLPAFNWLTKLRAFGCERIRLSLSFTRTSSCGRQFLV